MTGFTWTSIQGIIVIIIVTNHKQKQLEVSLSHKLNTLYACLNKWKKHILSGKITVIKIFSRPKDNLPIISLRQQS